MRGSGSWFPAIAFGCDVKALGSFPVNEPQEFFVYPDGRDGVEIRVPFRMTPAMISGSDRDRIQVEIHDDRVLVWGTAIEGTPVEFARRDGQTPPASASPAGPFPAAVVDAFIAEWARVGGDRTAATCLLAAIGDEVTTADLETWLRQPVSDPVAAAVDRELIAALSRCQQ